MSKQRAEVRVVVDVADDHALVMQATAKGDDFYCGVSLPDGSELLRPSFHASGQSHIHSPAGRLLHTPQNEPRLFEGRRRWFGGSPDLTLARWGYTPRPDNARRRTLRLPWDDLRQHAGWSIALWLVERSRDDLVQATLAEHDVIIGWTVTDWTQPMIMAFAWTMLPEKWESLERSVAERRT